MSRRAVRFFASLFGVGHFPHAPGTMGTVAAVPLALILSGLTPQAQLVLALASLPFAAMVCERAALLARQEDPSWVVLDEAVGFVYATLWLEPTVGGYLAAFALFRLFDIAKPGLVGRIDRTMGGGLGILLDDVVAGIMARVCLAILALAGLL